MTTIHFVGDMNGPVLCWGRTRFTLTRILPAGAEPAVEDEFEGFGDMNGPLAYWGPAAEAEDEAVELVA